MTSGWRHPLFAAALLAAPLAALTVWAAWGAVHRTHGIDLRAEPRSGASPGAAPIRTEEILAGFPVPDAVFPGEKLEDRVDGAADYLRAQGCVRLVYWHLAAPRADLELLSFETPAGARAVLARDAGTDRTPGPGDEAQVSDQAVYFRRGAQLVRLFADPDARGDPRLLSRTAEQIDRALPGGPPNSPVGLSRAAGAGSTPP